jgi:hypothetical protein
MHFILCFVGILIGAAYLFGQTNVSGGIYQNTTWSLSGTPYIVTGSIVVFPGKTLTIEPGCEVRFTADNTFNTGNFQYLEIRGSLVAVGTYANKIRFTSSDTTDGFYNWLGINIKGSQGGNVQLDHIELYNSFYGINNDISEQGVTYSWTNCKFKNNNYALQLNADMIYTGCLFEKNGVGQAAQISYGTLTATNCLFTENFCAFTWSNGINVDNCVFSGNSNTIVGSPGSIQNSLFTNNVIGIAESASKQINNCIFDGNDLAIDDNGGSIITNSQFYNNAIAIKLGEGSLLSNNVIENNGTGVQVRGSNPSGSQITNNQLCFNTNYNLENLTDKNFQVNANCFCSTDSAEIENTIYDGYDDITRGLVNYAIYDDSCENVLDYVTKVLLNETGGLSLALQNEYTIYPNPTNGVLFIVMPSENTDYFRVTDSRGKKVLEGKLNGTATQISLTELTSGPYFLEVGERQPMRVVRQ